MSTASLEGLDQILSSQEWGQEVLYMETLKSTTDTVARRCPPPIEEAQAVNPRE